MPAGWLLKLASYRTRIYIKNFNIIQNNNKKDCLTLIDWTLLRFQKTLKLPAKHDIYYTLTKNNQPTQILLFAALCLCMHVFVFICVCVLSII